MKLGDWCRAAWHDLMCRIKIHDYDCSYVPGHTKEIVKWDCQNCECCMLLPAGVLP